MPSVNLMQGFDQKEDLPAIVRFERMAVENKAETLRQRKWVGMDVDMVHITPPYSKEEVDKKVTFWLEQNDLKVVQGQMTPERRDRYRAEYEAWLKGQELPPEGTPIKGWGMASPAQQQAFIHEKILTVEMLAQINDEAMRRIGMGAVEMKQRAISWLAQNRDKGPLTIEMGALKTQNQTMKLEMDTMRKQIEDFKALLRAQGMTGGVVAPAPIIPDIAMPDIPEHIVPLGPPMELPKRPRGNPNWRKKEAQ